MTEKFTQWQQRVAELKQRKEAAEEKWEEANPPQESDSVEASDRCGIESARYPVPGLVIIETATKIPLAISYSAFSETIRWEEPCGLEWTFTDDRGTWRVRVVGGEGDEARAVMERLQLRLIQQKRELLWANGVVLKEIVIEELEEDEE